MTKVFQKSFFKDFWDESSYTFRDYTGSVITNEQIQRAEDSLGYKLPEAYVELLENKNGGVPKNTRFPSKKKTCWAKDHVAISGIHGINEHELSLLGEQGSRFMIEEWGYPNIGIIICDCPSGGEDVIMLDYRKCKKEGEPSVVHVDVLGSKPKITPLADNFEAFIRGLVNESVYAPPVDEEMKKALEKVTDGSFSPVLLKAFPLVQNKVPDIDQKLRRLATKIVHAKKGFYLHADELSMLMYDCLFWLFSHIGRPVSIGDYTNLQSAPSYEKPYFALMIALHDEKERYGFSCGAYAASFVQGWWKNRVSNGELIETPTGFVLTDKAISRILDELEKQTR